jgi:hypothetical protein
LLGRETLTLDRFKGLLLDFNRFCLTRKKIGQRELNPIDRRAGRVHAYVTLIAPLPMRLAVTLKMLRGIADPASLSGL